jgi:hypothetical protein
VAAAVVGFAGLTLEIAYTRIISFKLFYYYTYFVIGLALLGFGAAATVVALSSRLRDRDLLDTIRRLTPWIGAAGVAAYALVAALPTNVNQIWIGSPGRALSEFGLVLVLSLSLTSVFFGLGLIISLLIVVDSADVRSLYFWDLVGAALACVVAVPLQLAVGPPAMVLASLVAVVALGVGIAVVQGAHVVRATTGAVAVLVLAFVAGNVEVRTDAVKTVRPDSDVVASDWGAVFRVDVTPSLANYVLHHDGLWGSSIWEYDGTPRTTDRFLTDDRQIPWAALGRTPERVLIIGAAGGNEIMAALTYGADHVDAVELNPVTEELLTDRFADYAGHVTDDPRVNYVQGDGRTFLARSDDTYDLIWFVAPDSYAASNAATSGAFVLSESYLYTEEMIETAFDHLSSDGLMVAQFGDFDFETRPTRTARYLVTAREALDGRLGSGGTSEEFGDHLALVAVASDEELHRVVTIALSPDEIGAEAVGRIESAIGNVPGARAVHLPGDRGTGEGLTAEIARSDDAAVEAIVDDYEYDISSISDDRPFFWHFTSFADVISDFGRGLDDTEIAIGERLILMLLAAALIVAGLLLWAPFRLFGGDREGPPPGRWRLTTYFGMLGFGFFVIEISMIQRFSLLLGYPTLSLSVSLFTLLVSTAVGARISGWVLSRRHGLVAALVVLWAFTLLYLAIADSVTDSVLAWGQPMRIGLVIVLLFPVGIALGTFLPTGIDRARSLAAVTGSDDRRLVAWCWAVNGFFSVIGSTSTTMLSMTFGFDRTVMIGLVLYVVAVIVHETGSVEAPAADRGETSSVAGDAPVA